MKFIMFFNSPIVFHLFRAQKSYIKLLYFCVRYEKNKDKNSKDKTRNK